MVSMKDIARRCGVSVATVSKALNGQPDIGEETRARICTVAQEMGYMTNSAARALKTNRTYNLGVLFVDERRSGLAHEYFSSVLESFKVEAENHLYQPPRRRQTHQLFAALPLPGRGWCGDCLCGLQ